MKLLFILTSFFILNTTYAKLLDKIVAVVDDNVITQSMVKRINQNLPARKNISPFIYTKNKYTDKEIAKIVVNKYLIRSKLEELNIVISDDHVESEIKDKERALGLTREALLQFLKSNRTTFEEFFDITREAIEFNQFNARVISPLVSVTDQEVKNSYFKENENNKTLSFNYTLVDFSLSKEKVGKYAKKYKEALEDFQTNGVLPAKYKDVKTNVLEGITEDGLTDEIKKALSNTQEGQFSKPILLYGEYHVFFVKKKDLVESSDFLQQKNRIKSMIYAEKSIKLSQSWFEREASKHYVKYFL